MNRSFHPVDRLAYSIVPGELKVPPRPAMWGNGRVELLAELTRPCVSEAICFGFGPTALVYRQEEHLLPAIYDAATGRKYLLSTLTAAEARVTFRPDRQTWHYAFEELEVEVSLILPRVVPGYLMEVRVVPRPGNRCRRWQLYQELRGFHGNTLRATEADSDPRRGRVSIKSPAGHGEALGASRGAEDIRLGDDGPYATDIMMRLALRQAEREESAGVFVARGFGEDKEQAGAAVEDLLSRPEERTRATAAWWDEYLSRVPRVESPDEEFNRQFLWSWADFRQNRIEFPIGKSSYPGLCAANNLRLDEYGAITSGDHTEIQSVELLHDPEPARALMMTVLTTTRKQGLLSAGFCGVVEYERSYASCLAWFLGLLHKYLLATGDLAFLETDIGGMTVRRRLEGAVEAVLKYRDPATGLYAVDDEESTGLGSNMEAVTRYRGGKGAFFSDVSAVVHGSFSAMAEIQDLAGNPAAAGRYGKLADELRSCVQSRLWNDETGFFCDLHPDGSMSDQLTIGGFITGLYANHAFRPGGLATPAQAQRLAAWCRQPEFASEFGVLSLSRRHPHYDPFDYKGFSGGFDMHFCNQVAGGLYAGGCYEEAHRQLFKTFRKIADNRGLGPRYRGESYAETGEILPWRSVNYPCLLSVLNIVVEGVFGLRWTREALTIDVHAPWPWANLRNLNVRNRRVDIEYKEEAGLIVTANGKKETGSAPDAVRIPWAFFAGGGGGAAMHGADNGPAFA